MDEQSEQGGERLDRNVEKNVDKNVDRVDTGGEDDFEGHKLQVGKNTERQVEKLED